MQKTFIIFDVDGTLVFSNKIDSLCFAETYLEIYKIPFPTIDWQVFPHVTDHTIFKTVIQEEFGRIPDEKEIDYFRDQFVKKIQEKRIEVPEEFYEVPGAKKMMDQLIADDRFIIGVATGGWERPARLKLDFVNINVSPIYFSGADNKVSREDIVNDSIRQANAKNEQYDRIVYIGDAIWDVKTTRNMQMDLVGIRRNGDVEFLKKEGAQTVIENYLDYDQFLKAVDIATPPV